MKPRDVYRTWKPPITHLMDGETNHQRTLCGITIGKEWDVHPADDDDSRLADYIDQELACGCRKCAAIAKARIEASP